MPRPFVDLTGKRFGKLTVLATAEDSFDGGHRRRHWSCLCDCGGRKVVYGTNLTTGHARSCGCTVREMNARRQEAVPSYSGLHNRIRSQRGKASEFSCTDCGKQARDWSYDGQDPDDLCDLTRDGRRYSTDEARYSPRCVPCHRRFDSKVSVMA